MRDIHISRDHSLGLAQARKLALRWVEVAQEKLGVECTYEEGELADRVTFSRAGAHGALKVAGDRFELDARLGLLLGVFKDRIESEISKNIDLLLAASDPLQAFERALAEHAAAKPGGAIARESAAAAPKTARKG
jgi:putative polyhydroxyalkanoate system protein